MSMTLLQIKDKLEHARYDEDGWFDCREDRERYIRYLEMVNKAWSQDYAAVEMKLTKLLAAIDEQAEIKYLSGE